MAMVGPCTVCAMGWAGTPVTPAAFAVVISVFRSFSAVLASFRADSRSASNWFNCAVCAAAGPHIDPIAGEQSAIAIDANAAQIHCPICTNLPDARCT